MSKFVSRLQKRGSIVSNSFRKFGAIVESARESAGKNREGAVIACHSRHDVQLVGVQDLERSNEDCAKEIVKCPFLLKLIERCYELLLSVLGGISQNSPNRDVVGRK